MSKDDFLNLSDNERINLVSDALCNLIIFQELAPSLVTSLFKDGNIEVIKILLGAYMNGVIK